MARLRKKRSSARILADIVSKVAVSAIGQIRRTGDINPTTIDEVIEAAIPKMPKPKSVGFFDEENALGVVMEDGSIKAVFVGMKIEKFLCGEVIPRGPKNVVAWDDLQDVWNGSQGQSDLAKFKKRMKDAMSRINNRCGFTLFKGNKEGVFW